MSTMRNMHWPYKRISNQFPHIRTENLTPRSVDFTLNTNDQTDLTITRFTSHAIKRESIPHIALTIRASPKFIDTAEARHKTSNTYKETNATPIDRDLENVDAITSHRQETCPIA